MERLGNPSSSIGTKLTLSELVRSGHQTVSLGATAEHHDCAYCRSSAPTTYYAISQGRWIRHWLCSDCVFDLRVGGWEIAPLACAECRKPSDRHGTDHAYVPTGYGR